MLHLPVVLCIARTNVTERLQRIDSNTSIDAPVIDRLAVLQGPPYVHCDRIVR